MCDKATGLLREVQLLELEMLRDFKSVCEKHNLRYFVDFGSLLGAIRHKGFIPWDDDIDITMPYEDYAKFLKIAQEEMGEQYFIQTTETDPEFHFSYAKVKRNGTTMMDKTAKGWHVHHGVWLDIFPIIEINGGFELKLKTAIVEFYRLLVCDEFFKIYPEGFRKQYGNFGLKVIKLVHKFPKKVRTRFATWLMKPIYKAKNKKLNAIVWLTISKTVPKHIYEDSCKLEFEGETFDFPKNYEERLRLSYGDYMQLPPEEERKGHGNDVIIDLECDYTYYAN